MGRPCHCNRTVIGSPWVRGRDCVECWLWHHNPKSRAAWAGTPAPAAPPCARRGDDLTGLERHARGLDTRRWVWCRHPAKPLGAAVCPCRGCGPACPKYERPPAPEADP